MRTSLIFVCAATLLCLMTASPPALAQSPAKAIPFASQAYLEGRSTKGVVLFAVRWDRRWKCGGFENAQLRLIAFDKLPSNRTNDDQSADLVVADAPLVMTNPRFDDYAFLVEPGEYALSNLHIKAANSISDVRIAKIGRDRLIKDGRPEGGSFTAEAGEIVYIGHFYLDCYREPILWRYYLEDRRSFDAYMSKAKEKYPELDISKAQFHLFKTKFFGQDFELK